jgi:CheY-like chemotaxis protein
MSRSLLVIINDFLDLSKGEAGKLEIIPSQFTLRSMFDNLVSMNRFLAQSKGLEFRASFSEELPRVVFADEIRLRQIFSNLLSNALKYTKQGSITFTMEKETKYGRDYIRCQVKDTGMGIKKEDLGRLFGMFEQVNTDQTHNIEGTGLGLSIVKQLLELINGEVAVESLYGSGSTFTVFIPCVEGDSSKVAENASDISFVTAKNGASINVLVVDDSKVNLAVAAGFLRKHGITAETASGGQEALVKIKQQPFHLVFMDHMMPGIDGVETTRLIRSLGPKDASFNATEDYFQKLPVVALTANTVVGTRETFLNNGMNGFLPKPIPADALNKILLDLLPPSMIAINNLRAEAPGSPPPAPAPPRMSDTEDAEMLRKLRTVSELSADDGIHLNGGSLSMYLKMLWAALRSIPESRTRLAQCCGGKDWKNYAIEAHALKGIFATIAAQGLYQAGLELEFAAKDEKFDICEAKTDAFISAMTAFMNDLKPKIDRRKQGRDSAEPQSRQPALDTMIRKTAPVILAVDDSSFILDQIEEILDQGLKKNEIYELRKTKSSLTALKIFHEETVSLVLLDIDMPGMDGLEFLEYLKKQIYFKQTKIIFITSHAESNVVRQALKLGANGYIVKPIAADKLLAMVRKELYNE